MLDHVTLPVRDFARSGAFYRAALLPLGCLPKIELDGLIGFGNQTGLFFWIAASPKPSERAHVAFRAEQRAHIDQFHAAACAAGGTDNGAPGLRPEYGAGYYAAYVFDLDGNNIEAVLRT